MCVCTNLKKSLLFGGLTLLGSLLLWGSLILFQFEVPNLETGEVTTILPMLVYIFNGFLPSIVGIILYFTTSRSIATSRLRSLIPDKTVSRSSLILVIGFILIFVLQTVLYNLFIGGYDYNVIVAQIAQLLPLIILGPLSEEIGWRGYFQDQFNKDSPLRTSIIIGVVWGLWHLPLFFILGTTQQTNNVSFITFIILTTIVSYIMTLVYNRHNGSLFLSVLIHYLYTVIMTFYVLGTSYSVLSDILSILPVLAFAILYTVLPTFKSTTIQET